MGSGGKLAVGVNLVPLETLNPAEVSMERMIRLAPCLPTRLNHRWSALDGQGVPCCKWCGKRERDVIRDYEMRRYGGRSKR